MLVFIHTIASIALAIYAAHEGALLLLFLRYRLRQTTIAPSTLEGVYLPAVTVQIPLFNEGEVTRRVIAAVCSLSYPASLLQVQVLDDSTDCTKDVACAEVSRFRSQGIDVTHIHRAQRTGFKAGAMRNGLHSATGEFIGVFDADFAPAPDWLLRALPYFKCDTLPSPTGRHCEIGFVQTCWDFSNRQASAITRAESMMLDMHFKIEQPARSASGLLMNFNGSGGLWRRACIDSSGGWQTDTLAEDLDLSYRSLLMGWRACYVTAIPAPGEVVPNFSAFKSQQRRWSRGSAQNFKKLAGRVLQAPIPPLKRIAGMLHLSGYLIHAFLLILTITVPLTALLPTGSIPWWLGIFSLSGALPMITMFAAHAERRRSLSSFLADVPMAIMIGVGMSVSNTVGWLEGLISRSTGEWIQSPKGQTLDRRDSTPALTVDPLILIELVVGLYSLAAAVYLGSLGIWISAGSCAIYASGFLGVVALQAARR